jgi:hypothetical protein
MSLNKYSAESGASRESTTVKYDEEKWKRQIRKLFCFVGLSGGGAKGGTKRALTLYLEVRCFLYN